MTSPMTLVWYLGADVDEDGNEIDQPDQGEMMVDDALVWGARATKDSHDIYCEGRSMPVCEAREKGREWHRREVERRLRGYGLVFDVREEPCSS